MPFRLKARSKAISLLARAYRCRERTGKLAGNFPHGTGRCRRWRSSSPPSTARCFRTSVPAALTANERRQPAWCRCLSRAAISPKCPARPMSASALECLGDMRSGGGGGNDVKTSAVGHDTKLRRRDGRAVGIIPLVVQRDHWNPYLWSDASISARCLSASSFESLPS